jgi:hypothetical protein
MGPNGEPAVAGETANDIDGGAAAGPTSSRAEGAAVCPPTFDVMGS